MLSFFRQHNERLGILMGAITLVGLGFLTQRLFEVDRPCLSFSGVMELRFEGVPDPLRSCASQSRFVNQPLTEDQRKILNAINDLNQIEDLLPRHLRGVSITITASDPFFFIQSERSLVIGNEIIQTSEFLQRAVINALSSQVLGGNGTKKKDLVSDLIWSFWKGEDKALDPGTLEPVNTPNWIQMAQTPKTIGEYCAHPLRRLEDLSFCRFETNRDQEISAWMRYRPLISWTLVKVLRDHGLSAVTGSLRKLMDVQVEPSESETQLSDELWVRERITQWLTVMSVSLDDEALDALWSEHRIESTGNFDFVVHVDSDQLADQAVASLLEWQDQSMIGRNSKVLVIAPNGQVEIPFAKRTHYALEKVISSTHLILGCELPAMREVAGLKTNSLLAFKVCNSLELPRWAEILKEGQNDKNANLRIRLHMPSAKRWSEHHGALIARGDRLDSIFCDQKTYLGYPFQVQGCGKTPASVGKN